MGDMTKSSGGFPSTADELMSNYSPGSRGSQRHVLMATTFNKENDSPLAGIEQ